MGNLEVDKVSIQFDHKKVIKNCSFHVKKGEIVTILGASGEGKTSLLKAIGGFAEFSGEIRFDNEQIKGPNEQLVPGHPTIRLINQDFNLDQFHTVEENIRLKLLCFDEGYRNERVQRLIRLTKLTAYKNNVAKSLSGGQKQRLAIARALADEPEFVLLDEPFNQLDYGMKSKISQHIRNYLKSNQIGAILVTHNGGEAMEWSDRIVFLEKGKIKRSALPESFYHAPSSYREASFFGAINRIKMNGEVYCFRPSDFTIRKGKKEDIALQVCCFDRQFLGWYSAFHFHVIPSAKNVKRQVITLYSEHDISTLDEIFIKKMEFND